MSIPPISAIGVALSAAKASSAVAADLVEAAANKAGAFADVLSADPDTNPQTAIDADSSKRDTSNRSVSELIGELKERLGISFGGPISIQLEEDGHIKVESETATDRMEPASDRDLGSRMKLQAFINGNEPIRRQVAAAIEHLPLGSLLME